MINFDIAQTARLRWAIRAALLWADSDVIPMVRVTVAGDTLTLESTDRYGLFRADVPCNNPTGVEYAFNASPAGLKEWLPARAREASLYRFDTQHSLTADEYDNVSYRYVETYSVTADGMDRAPLVAVTDREFPRTGQLWDNCKRGDRFVSSTIHGPNLAKLGKLAGLKLGKEFPAVGFTSGKTFRWTAVVAGELVASGMIMPYRPSSTDTVFAQHYEIWGED